MRTDFPDGDDILNFFLYIEPDEGMYKGGVFKFRFAVPETFPHEPPKVNCEQKIYHPNIDVEGKICLNILREDWKPVLNLQAIVIGLQVCFGEGERGIGWMWFLRRFTSCVWRFADGWMNSSSSSNPMPRIR